MNDITVLIPTSPIPSHPFTDILDETIANIRKYTDAEIIIMFDGVHSSLEDRRKDYEKYRGIVIDKIASDQYGDCRWITFPVHNHQSMMTKYVLQKVETPLIMFCEHDTSPIGDIPFGDICDFVRKSYDVNCVRFNIFHEIPADHQYLMLDKNPTWYEIMEPKSMGGVGLKLVRTIQWSQRPHIAKTEWYIKILNTYFEKTPRSMIEDVMHSVVQTSYDQLGKDIFGLAIYTPDGNQLRSYHADGRGTDGKIISG